MTILREEDMKELSKHGWDSIDVRNLSFINCRKSIDVRKLSYMREPHDDDDDDNNADVLRNIRQQCNTHGLS